MNNFFCRTREQAADLAERLRRFYEETPDYLAFHAPSHQIRLWCHVSRRIRSVLGTIPDGKVRILEAGAGRSGLAQFMKTEGLRERVHLHAQDVTSQNIDWLRDQFDGVTVGSVSDVPGTFDIVLSSYVLEHVSNPVEFLEGVWGKVACGGALFLTCPRYDVPFYLPRSADHLPASRRFCLSIGLMMRRLRTWVTGRPAWLVHGDPAVFHLPFFRDRDAVHWVSWYDLRAWWPDVRRLPLDYRGIRDGIRIRLLTVGLVREKS